MKSIAQAQEEIVREFQEMGDSFDQYAYLVELSCQLPALPEEKKTPERAVKGCQSSVWLDMKAENGVFTFAGDSNTLILKGILYLLEELLCGQSARDVAEAKLDFLQKTAILDTFESERRKGVGFVIRELQSFAAEHA